MSTLTRAVRTFVVACSVLTMAMFAALPASKISASIADGGAALAQAASESRVRDDVQRISWAVLGRSATASEVLEARALLTNGGSLADVVVAAAEGTDFATLLDVDSDDDFVDGLYQAVLVRNPDAGGRAYWLRRLASGTPRAMIVVAIAFSGEFQPGGDSSGGDSPADGDGFRLDILHINDHHSHLQADDIGLPLGGLEEVNVDMGGFARVAGFIKDVEDDNANTVKIHAGDAITGTLFYSLFKGEADAAVMNEVCFDIFELGNHEFDDSDQGLDYFLDWLNAGDCDTTTLAANVVPAVGTPLAPTSATDYFEPYVVKDYDGTKVGFIGIDIAQKTKVSSSPLDSTEFLDEVATSQRYVDELQEMGIENIVIVSHYQYRNDLALAAQVTGIDAIVGGDSHTLLGDEFNDLGLVADGAYPTLTTNADGDPVCVVQAWQYSNVVGHLTVNFNDSGVVTNCGGAPNMLLGDNFTKEVPDTSAEAEEGDTVDEALTGDELTAVLSDIEASPVLTVVQPDAATAAIIEEYSGLVDELEQQVIGTASEDLCLARIPNDTRTQIPACAGNTPNGGDIQQLVTESFLARAFRSEIALQNSGGIRVDIPAGPLTIADAYTLLPFANTMVELDLTGAEIKATLEEGLTNHLDNGGSSGAYPYAAGLRYDVDMGAPSGERFSNLEYNARGTDTWVPLDATASYIVVTNSFMASGGDGYTTMGEKFDAGLFVDTGLDYAQTFIDYIEQDAGGVIGRVPSDRYSTQNFIPDDVAALPQAAIAPQRTSES